MAVWIPSFIFLHSEYKWFIRRDFGYRVCPRFRTDGAFLRRPPPSIIGVSGDDINAMNEFQANYRRMIALGVHIRSAIRRRGLRYLARRAWSKIGVQLGWSCADLGCELDRTYTSQGWLPQRTRWPLNSRWGHSELPS